MMCPVEADSKVRARPLSTEVAIVGNSEVPQTLMNSSSPYTNGMLFCAMTIATRLT